MRIRGKLKKIVDDVFVVNCRTGVNSVEEVLLLTLIVMQSMREASYHLTWMGNFKKF